MTDREELERLRALAAQEATAPRKRLSPGDAAVRAQVESKVTPASIAADTLQDITPGNIAELEKEIAKTPPGRQRDILIAEHNRIKKSIPSDDAAARARLAELEAKAAKVRELKKEPPPKPAPPKPKVTREYTISERLTGDPSGTIPERIAGNPLMRAVMGNPLVQATRAAANLVPGLGKAKEQFQEYEELEKVGRAGYGDEGLDIPKMLGGLIAPWGRFVPAGAGPVRTAGGMAGAGAVGGFTAPGNVTPDDYIASTLGGAALGGVLPVAGGLARGTVHSLDRVLPGGPGRIATRRQIRDIGEENVEKIISTIQSRPRELVPGSVPRTAQLVGDIPEGAPIVAREARLARTPGGVGAAIAHSTEAQIGAREKLINTLVRSKVSERSELGKTLAKANREGPLALSRALAEAEIPANIPLSMAQRLLQVRDDVERAVTARRPQYPVNLPADLPAGLFPHIPFGGALNTVSDLIGGAMSRGADPRIARVQAQRALDPDAYAAAMAPPGSIQEIVNAILRSSAGPTGLTAAEVTR